MNDKSDTERLAKAVAHIATTITEIIEFKIRESADAAKADKPLYGDIHTLARAEGWVSKKEAAAHFKISQRTFYDWMKKRLIPYIRIGRSARFKLSDVDAAMNRRLGVECRY